MYSAPMNWMCFIKVIAMEITHESHIEEIDTCLEKLGRPTGVMLQVGTRNTQNFELLKAIGRQSTYPVLFFRGTTNSGTTLLVRLHTSLFALLVSPQRSVCSARCTPPPRHPCPSTPQVWATTRKVRAEPGWSVFKERV